VSDEALDAAQSLRQREPPHGAQQVIDALTPIDELKAEHSAEARLLRLSQGVLRVRGQTWVVHLGNGGVLLEELGDGLGPELMGLHAKQERLEPASTGPTVIEAAEPGLGKGSPGAIPDEALEVVPVLRARPCPRGGVGISIGRGRWRDARCNASYSSSGDGASSSVKSLRVWQKTPEDGVGVVRRGQLHLPLTAPHGVHQLALQRLKQPRPLHHGET
jgi:hypothetical protein